MFCACCAIYGQILLLSACTNLRGFTETPLTLHQFDALPGCRKHYFNVRHYWLVSFLKFVTRECPFVHNFVLHHRQTNASCVLEWYRNNVCLRVFPMQTTSRHKHVETTMRPMTRISHYRHLNTYQSSLSFDVSELDRTWKLWEPQDNRNHRLNFSAFFNRIRPISTIMTRMWIIILIESRTINSCLSMTYLRSNRRIQESTTSSNSIVPLSIPWSPWRILPYQVPFSGLPETSRSEGPTSRIRATRAWTRYVSSSSDRISNKRKEDNFALWLELLDGSNQKSSWLAKLSQCSRTFSPGLRCRSHQKLYRRLRRLRGIHNPFPIF